MPKILECYPFADDRVRLVEGFASYDGLLGDTPGTPHKGIDYVLPEGEGISFDDGVKLISEAGFNSNGLRALGFEVFCMHAGSAYQAISGTWGRFVAITSHPRQEKSTLFRVVYAHLGSINEVIPQLPVSDDPAVQEKLRKEFKEIPVDIGDYLGRAGNTGRTNRIIQLHIELFECKGEGGSWQKIDPYGIFTKPASSGAYPQPGQSLKSLRFHRWITDDPPLAVSTRKR